MTDNGFDLSEALVLYLKHYPGENDNEFDVHYGADVALLRGEPYDRCSTKRWACGPIGLRCR